jgi:hypothetical protein
MLPVTNLGIATPAFGRLAMTFDYNSSITIFWLV